MLRRRDIDEPERGQSGRPHKRRMTSKSPDPPAYEAWHAVTTASLGTTTTLAAATTTTATATAVAVPGSNDDGSADREERPIERLFSERVVEIVVGPSQTVWRLHENLLSGTSDFFRAAFNSGFKESLEDRLLLPEDDPQAFELFVRWLYARALQGLTGAPEMNAELQLFGSSTSSTSSSSRRDPGFIFSTSVTTPIPSTASPPINIQDCLRLYALATKLLVEDLENICVDVAARYYKVGTRRPEIRDVQYIYENTPEGSGMRRLLKERLALVLFRGRQSNNKDKPVTPEWRDVIEETPELGFDLLSEVASYNWVPGPSVPPTQRLPGEGCVFHRHEKTAVCRPR